MRHKPHRHDRGTREINRALGSLVGARLNHFFLPQAARSSTVVSQALKPGCSPPRSPDADARCAVSLPRLDPVRSLGQLPETSALDALDATALVEEAKKPGFFLRSTILTSATRGADVGA